MAMNKRTKAATESLAFLGVIAVSLVLLNILGVFAFGRIDVTGKRLFSLSEGSKRVVASLEDDLEVTAYFTKDLPPPFNATERYVRDILDEYAAASKGKVHVKFVNPDSDEKRSAADADGVQKVAHQKIENDAVQVVEGYRGIVFKYLGERKAIPSVAGTDGLEYEITQTLKQLTGEKIKLGVVGGHGGPSVADKMNTMKTLLPTYDLVDVQAGSPIDQSLRALLIIAPETPFSDDELRNIDAFVMKGGSLGVFGGTVKIAQEGQDLTAKPADTGINRLLEKWGVKMRSELVADAQCGQMPMRTQLGISIPVPYPPMPVIGFEEKSSHPVLFRLEQAVMPFAVPLKVTGSLKNSKDLNLTVLAQSSKNSWLLKGDSIDLKPRNPREWAPAAYDGPQPVAIAIEGKLPSAFAAEAVTSAQGAAPVGPKGPAIAEKPVHVLVLGSNSLFRDDFLPPPDKMGDQLLGFVAMPLNAIDWLAQEDALIAVRAKSVEEPLIEVPATVKEAEQEATAAAKQGDQSGTEAALEKRKAAIEDWDAKKLNYRIFNIAFMPLLFIAFGVIRWQMRKQKRAKISL
jgi:gliding-associated putative ABC transporter substrate-binding component GldG